MNSDCIVIMGSNMAENHPVGFQWVMEARERGAQVIHVDPRFTRTSAMATRHVGIRAGSDIAFLGGIANYILQNDRWFREYVEHYTNAPVIINEEFADTEELDGLFSGWDTEESKYDIESWMYEGMEIHGSAGQREQGFKPTKGEASGHGGHGGGLHHGEPPSEDETMQHPRCVLQLLKKHYARYTPEFVAETCGCSVEDFVEVCEPLIDDDNSVYWTVEQMLERKVKGYIIAGENPAVGHANGKAHRLGLSRLEWLVVRDVVEIESASFWYDGPEVESGELAPEQIATEIFFLPAATHTEKDGSFTNTQRLLQWHWQAVEPKQDCRSDLWFYFHLGRL